MKIRHATEQDVPVLREVYRDSVVSQAPAFYTIEQTRAWARTADSPGLARTILAGTTLVAEVNTRVAGFCTVQPDGRIALLYVRGEFSRRGIGSLLLRAALVHAGLTEVESLYAEASELSLPLFEKLGFALIETEHSVWNGVGFLRHRVRKDL